MATVSIANEGKIMEGQEMDPVQKYVFQTLKPRLEGPLDELRRLTFELHPKAAHMQTSPEQILFLQLQARALHARRIIDVGCFTGYSACALALALADEPDARVVSLEIDEKYPKSCMHLWKKAGAFEKIDLKIGPAISSLERLLAAGGEGQYDMAYVDASKPEYNTYFELCLKLIRPGGLIAMDNMLWTSDISGHVADEKQQHEWTNIIRALNTKLSTDERIHFALLPIAAGLALCLKK